MTTTTITMTGDSTGYGASTGSEAFLLGGYRDSVMLQGANDSVTIGTGGLDTIDLNASGFSWGVTDSVALGQSVFDTIGASHALQGAALSITGGGGEIDVALVNHGGATTLSLGNTGDVVNAAGLGLNDVVSLNGDAENSVTFQNGGGADVAIGQAGDGFAWYASSVALAGNYNLLTGGDEQFNVSGAGGLNRIALGNGNDTLSFGAGGNSIALGNGNDSVSLAGQQDSLALGTGNNVVSALGGAVSLRLAAGGAGASDTLALGGSHNAVHGGDENVTLTNAHGGALAVLGNGNDTITLASGHVVLGDSAANTARDNVTILNGHAAVTLNGGTDGVTLADAKSGWDQVVLNGTDLGTRLSAAGSFDTITLAQDANAAISDAAVNGGLSLIFDGDAQGGLGVVSVTGLAQDDIAKITLSGCGSYSVTADNTALGGVTLHFAHGTIDLIGTQSLSNVLITQN